MPIIVSHTLILHRLYRQLLLNEIGLCTQNIYTKILSLIVNTNWEGLCEPLTENENLHIHFLGLLHLNSNFQIVMTNVVTTSASWMRRFSIQSKNRNLSVELEMSTYLTPCTDACMLLKHGQSLTIIDADIYFMKIFWFLAADLQHTWSSSASQKLKEKTKSKKYLARILNSSSYPKNTSILSQ